MNIYMQLKKLIKFFFIWRNKTINKMIKPVTFEFLKENLNKKKLAVIKDPGKEQLIVFIDGAMGFLGYYIEDTNFIEPWGADLHDMARIEFKKEILPSAEELRKAIIKVEEKKLQLHGLIGTSANFKYKVLDSVTNNFIEKMNNVPNVKDKIKHPFIIIHALRKVFEAIDVILGSIVDVAGVGGIIREFKDALMVTAT